MIQEAGPEFAKYTATPLTYKRIKQLTAEARKADGWVNIGANASFRAR